MSTLPLEPPDRGCLFVVSGPSGVGKSTLIRHAMARVPDVGFSVSATTRAPRPGEKQGVSYHFLSDGEFEERLAGGEFLEHARVYDRWYGTLRAPVVAALEAGRSVVLDIDVQGARQVTEAMPDAVRVFVLPPRLASLEARLHARGTEAEATIRRRMDLAAQQLAEAPEYDYVVVNDDREAACAVFEGIVLAELHRCGLRQRALERVIRPL